jgi:hypothetical protein
MENSNSQAGADAAEQSVQQRVLKLMSYTRKELITMAQAIEASHPKSASKEEIALAIVGTENRSDGDDDGDRDRPIPEEHAMGSGDELAPRLSFNIKRCSCGKNLFGLGCFRLF